MAGRTIRITQPDVRVEDLEYVRDVVQSGWLTNGPAVRGFEEKLRERLGAGHVVACSSGTAALQLALKACGLGPGDEVLVPAFTFPATANAVENVGARPVLVDIHLPSFNIDLDLIEAKIGDKTRAILPVHQFGRPVDLDALCDLARRRDLMLIEDAACALGAEHDGRKCGTAGRAGCFSFHPRKVITTGEGGAVVTNDRAVAEACRELRNHGLAAVAGGLDFRRCGYNFRMSDLNAAIGLPQIARLDEILGRRTRLAHRYASRMREIPGVVAPESPANMRHAYQSYVVLLDPSMDRDLCVRLLHEQGIEAGAGARAIHALPFYKETYGYAENDIPNAWRAARSALALPLYPAMTDDDVDWITDAFSAAVEECASGAISAR